MTITAKYAGQCRKCGGQINVGDQVEWVRGNGAAHVHCPEAVAPVVGQFRTTVGSSCKRDFTAGQALRNKQISIERGEPEWLYVLSVTSRYYREDGMSFGVGDESGYVYALTCREATDDESAALRAKRDEKERKALALTELNAIAKDIQNLGEKPEGQNRPEGEIVVNTRDAYGSGDWFVLGEKYTWYVRNNGMDGDNWSANNVQTGGAGAIGWRTNEPGIAESIRDAARRLQ